MKEFAPAEVIYSEGNVVLECPAQSEVPTQTVQFKELVTTACVGETISVEATGYSYVAKTLRQRLIVHYRANPTLPWTLVTRTERETINANGTFKDSIDSFTFNNVGIYRFLYRVWKPDGLGGWVIAGQAINRTVTVTECPVE